MPQNAFNTTTLSEALTASTGEFAVASTTNITAGDLLAIRNELVKVQEIPLAGRVKVMRGVSGTEAKAHPSGQRFFIIANPEDTKTNAKGQLALINASGVYPDYLFPGQRAQDGEIRLHLRPQGRLMKRRRRMIHRHHRSPSDLPRLAVNVADARSGEEAGHRESPKRNDDPRIDDSDLGLEVLRTGVDLVRRRIAVSRRSALHDVTDEDLLARQADPGQELLQETPGGSHERLALFVLMKPRPFADEHDGGVDRSLAGDRQFARLMEAAIGATADRRRKLSQLLLSFHGAALRCVRSPGSGRRAS